MNGRVRSVARKGWLVPIVCVVTLLIPVLAWLISAGNPFDYLTHDVPPGQSLFLVAKLCGLLALALFWLQCMTALAKFSPALRGFFHLRPSRHVLLGSITFVLILVHIGLFVAASSLRTQHAAFALLIPKFDQGYYAAHISYGAIAFWLVLGVMIAGAIRLRGHLRWRWAHRGVFVVFGLALLHGIAIGSETRFGPMRYVYAFIALSLASALCSWLWVLLRSRLEGMRRRSALGAMPGAARSNE